MKTQDRTRYCFDRNHDHTIGADANASFWCRTCHPYGRLVSSKTETQDRTIRDVKKYKLLKDLPYIQAGAVFTYEDGEYVTYDKQLSNIPEFEKDIVAYWVVENNPEWFAELKQPEKQEIEIAEENVINYLDKAKKILKSNMANIYSHGDFYGATIEIAKMLQQEAVNKLLKE